MTKLDLAELVRNFPENGMKRLLENQTNAQNFMRIMSAISDEQTQQTIGAINLARLRWENTTLVKADYRHLISDIIFSAPLRNIAARKKKEAPEKGVGNATIYILIEHLSTPERLTPLVVLDYVTQIYVSQAR